MIKALEAKICCVIMHLRFIYWTTNILLLFSWKICFYKGMLHVIINTSRDKNRACLCKMFCCSCNCGLEILPYESVIGYLFPNLLKTSQRKKEQAICSISIYYIFRCWKEARCTVVSMSDILSNLLMFSLIPPVPSESPFCWETNFLK